MPILKFAAKRLCKALSSHLSKTWNKFCYWVVIICFLLRGAKSFVNFEVRRLNAPGADSATQIFALICPPCISLRDFLHFCLLLLWLTCFGTIGDQCCAYCLDFFCQFFFVVMDENVWCCEILCRKFSGCWKGLCQEQVVDKLSSN